MANFHLENLSKFVWKIVENDRFGQYPFLYVILGVDKVILIDTGCGGNNYIEFVTKHINTKKLPYLVVCTHVHFDHIGANYQFENETEPKCLGICMGSNNKKFTENYEINSLSLAHSTAVKKFTITRWLSEGDKIYLDDKNTREEEALEVLFTPGHTPDSISLLAPFDKRIFVGDILYPFTAIHLDSIGSSLSDYIQSIKKIIKRIQPVNTLSTDLSDKANQILQILGFEEANAPFNAKSLLELCDGNVEESVSFFLMSGNDVKALCPPVLQTQSTSMWVLSCGHVEANLNSECLEQVLATLRSIILGQTKPSFHDGDYGEYSSDMFTFLISSKQIKALDVQSL